jgi:hypothetical protein
LISYRPSLTFAPNPLPSVSRANNKAPTLKVSSSYTYEGEDLDGVVNTSSASDFKGLEGEGLLALELVEQLEALESGSLLEVGRDLSSLSSGTLQRK